MLKQAVRAALILAVLLFTAACVSFAEGFAFHADAGMASMLDQDTWNTGFTLKGTGFNAISENHPNLRLGFGIGVSWFGVDKDGLTEDYGSLLEDASGNCFIMEIGPMLRYATDRKTGFDYFGEIGLNYTRIWGTVNVDGSYSGWSFGGSDEFGWDEAGIVFGGGVVLWNKLELKPEYHMFIDSDSSNYFTVTAGYVFGK